MQDSVLRENKLRISWPAFEGAGLFSHVQITLQDRLSHNDAYAKIAKWHAEMCFYKRKHNNPDVSPENKLNGIAC